MPPSRYELWTELHSAYVDGPYANELMAETLAAACLIFRDAAWATDLYPTCSHGMLGITITADYLASRGRRSIWLAADEEHRPVVRYQEGLGSTSGRDERVADFREPTLKALALWVRGRGDEDAG